MDLGIPTSPHTVSLEMIEKAFFKIVKCTLVDKKDLCHQRAKDFESFLKIRNQMKTKTGEKPYTQKQTGEHLAMVRAAESVCDYCKPIEVAEACLPDQLKN